MVLDFLLDYFLFVTNWRILGYTFALSISIWLKCIIDTKLPVVDRSLDSAQLLMMLLFLIMMQQKIVDFLLINRRIEKVDVEKQIEGNEGNGNDKVNNGGDARRIIRPEDSC